jgi:hypothetical protein
VKIFMNTDITTALTDEQQEVVRSPLTPGRTHLVLARAGCGKTTTLEALCRARTNDSILASTKLPPGSGRDFRQLRTGPAHAFSYRRGYKSGIKVGSTT